MNQCYANLEFPFIYVELTESMRIRRLKDVARIRWPFVKYRMLALLKNKVLNTPYVITKQF